jgi:hypothetical protein
MNVVVLNVIILSDVNLSVVMLNVIMLSVVLLSVVILSDIKLSVVMLNIIMLSVVILSVMAPLMGLCEEMKVYQILNNFLILYPSTNLDNLIILSSGQSSKYFTNVTYDHNSYKI